MPLAVQRASLVNLFRPKAKSDMSLDALDITAVRAIASSGGGGGVGVTSATSSPTTSSAAPGSYYAVKDKANSTSPQPSPAHDMTRRKSSGSGKDGNGVKPYTFLSWLPGRKKRAEDAFAPNSPSADQHFPNSRSHSSVGEHDNGVPNADEALRFMVDNEVEDDEFGGIVSNPLFDDGGGSSSREDLTSLRASTDSAAIRTSTDSLNGTSTNNHRKSQSLFVTPPVLLGPSASSTATIPTSSFNHKADEGPASEPPTKRSALKVSSRDFSKDREYLALRTRVLDAIDNLPDYPLRTDHGLAKALLDGS